MARKQDIPTKQDWKAIFVEALEENDDAFRRLLERIVQEMLESDMDEILALARRLSAREDRSHPRRRRPTRGRAERVETACVRVSSRLVRPAAKTEVDGQVGSRHDVSTWHARRLGTTVGCSPR